MTANQERTTAERPADSDGQLPAMTVQIAAGQLHIADVIREPDGLYQVTSLRLQGAPPEVCVEFAGVPGRRHFPMGAPVSVLRRRGRQRCATQDTMDLR